jgi:hypothetical protein
MSRKILLVLFLLFSATVSLNLLISWKIKSTEPDSAAIEASVVKSFSILQQSGAKFINKTKCASCHHNTLTSMIAEKLTTKGITGVDTTARLRVMAMSNSVHFVCNPNLVNQFITAKFLSPYILLGLNAEKFQANLSTDLSVDYLISQELPDGSFKAEYSRVPLESGDIHLTAFCIRAIQLYAAPTKEAEVKQLVSRTRQWLEKQNPTEQQELTFQLLGMQWCGSNQALKAAVAEKLLALQDKDGGWSQLPTMTSDAYATGQVLYALAEAGISSIKNAAYQNGISYLLKTQDASGAWIVATRSNPIQPFINTDFPPYDDNQYISAAATNWAALALADALPDKKQAALK